MQTPIETPLPASLQRGGALAETGAESATTAVLGILIVAIFVGGFVYLIAKARRPHAAR